MKVHFAATLLALLLNYLALSKGALSPPWNLTVELLDFKALARWLPGPGNTKGTIYSLEFIDIAHFNSLQWNQTGNCTNITSTQCYLSLNQNILTEYYIRVRSKSEEECSEWKCLTQSIQPYYTLLSAPKITVLTEGHSIKIYLSHPVQLLMEVKIRFSVNLFQIINSSAMKHIAQKITTNFSSFPNLPSGSYYINASAFLTAEQNKNNNATIRVFLHHKNKEVNLWVIIFGVLLLLTLPAMISLIIIYCYVKPQRNSYMPQTLIIAVTGMSPIFNDEEYQAFSVSRIFIDKSTASKHEAAEKSSQRYFQSKGVHQGSFGKKIKENLLSENDGYPVQDLSTESDRYITAEKMEESHKNAIEHTDSSESLDSDIVPLSNYESRPDPLSMFNL